MDVADLRVKFSADGVQSTVSQMDQVNSKISNVGATATRVGGLMTMGLTLPILAFGRSAFMSASDAEEAINKVNVVFGETAPIITAWASTSATQLGISKTAALDAAGSFGNLFLNMGNSQVAAAGLSQDVVQLAVDMSSFTNIPYDQAIRAIGSAMMGENEPVKAFNVALSDTAVQAEAVRLGLWDGKGAIDANARAQAALSLITQQTTLMHGDFANTSDQAANSMRIARAQFADAAAVLGTQLLPAGTQVVQMFGNMTGALAGMSPEQQKAATGAAAFLAVLGPLGFIVGAVIRSWQGFASVLGSIIAPLSAATALFVLFSPILVPLSAGLALLKTNFLGIGDAMRTVASTISGIAGSVASAGTALVQGLATAITTAKDTVLSVSISGIGTAILTPFANAGTWLVQAGTDVVSGMAGAVDEAVTSVLSVSVSGVVTAILTPFANAGEWLVSAGESVVNGLASGIYNAIPYLSGAVDAVKGAVGGIIDYIDPRSPSHLMQPVGESVPQGLAVGIDRMLPGLAASVRAMSNTIGFGGTALSLNGPNARLAFTPALTGGGGSNAIGVTNIYYVIEPGSYVGPSALREIESHIQSGGAKRIDRRIMSSRIQES